MKTVRSANAYISRFENRGRSDRGADKLRLRVDSGDFLEKTRV